MARSPLKPHPGHVLFFVFVLAAGCTSSPPLTPDATRDLYPGRDRGLPDSGKRANGSLGVWNKLPSMLLPRANHCSAVVNGYLVVVGGNYKPEGAPDFVKTDTVQAARLRADGSLGDWKEAGRTQSPVTECVATADGNRLVVVDGMYDNASHSAQVWVSEMAGDGTLGSWISWGPLPASRRALSGRAWIVGGNLAVISVDLDPGAVLLLRAPIITGGLGAWSTDTVLPEFRGRAQIAAEGARLWLLGGYRSGAQEVAADVFVSQRNPETAAYEGGVPAGKLPQPRAFGVAVALDGYVFVIGGRTEVFGGEGLTQVAVSQADPGGRLEVWKAPVALPEGRTNHQAAVGGEFLYVTGGSVSGPGVDTVFTARIRF